MNSQFVATLPIDDDDETYPSEVFVLTGILQIEFLFIIFRHAGQHAIKYVVIPLGRVLCHDTRFLQQILLDISAFNCAMFVETNVDVFAETRRIIIPHSFGISKS